jgi:hypothetical protein
MPYWLGVHRSFSRWGQAGSFSRVSAFRHPVLAQMQAIATPAAPKGLTARARLALAGVSHRYAVRLWHVRAHLGARLSRPYREPAAQQCLDRVARLAGVLVSAGAISEQTQVEVVGEMEAALAARSLIDQATLAGYFPRLTMAQKAAFASLSRHAGRPGPATAGPVRAVPVGASAEYEVRGRRIRAFLGTLIIDSGSATLTVTARLLPSPTAPPPADDELIMELDECTAIDDRGSRYHAAFSGGGDDERWDGTFELQPVPSAGVRWLDVSVQGADPVRVDMSARAPAYPVTSAPLADGAANRYLDRLTLNMLLARRSAIGLGDFDEDHAVEAVTDLLKAGQLAADNQALGRLAAAAELLELQLPAQLAELKPGRLPDDWLVMLSRWDSEDGPVGTIPLAGQLPELDGLQCLITSIESERESASIRVHARGRLQHRHHGLVNADPFEWTARDDGGCLYVVEESQGSYGDDCAHLTLQLRPAIRPGARALTISITGKSAEVGVTVPLDWQECP